jgi:hypothetical protein
MADAPEITARAVTITEAQIQRGITDLLKQLGFECYHTRYSIGSDSGFPDVVAVRDDGTLVAVECKGPKGKIRPGQLEWIRRFRSIPGCIFAEIVGPEMNDYWWGYDQALRGIESAVTQRREES